jgi:hypothetical protein
MRRVYVLCVASVFILSARPAPAALTHRYSFNDGTADDSVGNAHGVLVNGAKVQNRQLVFDPLVNNGRNNNVLTGQYLDLPNNIARSTALTVEVWTTFRGGDAWQRIVDFGNNSTGRELNPGDPASGYYGIGFIMLTPNNRFDDPIAQISLNSSGGAGDTDLVGAVNPLSRNVQHHIVFTHDPAVHLETLSIDGVRVGNGTARVNPALSNYANYWIGRSNFQADPFYNGTINELRIYNHALTQPDITRNGRLGPDVLPEPGPATLLLLAGLPALLRRRRP